MRMKEEKDLNYYKEMVAALKDMLHRTTTHLQSIQTKLEITNGELRRINQEHLQSINYAEGIQRNLLPDKSAFDDYFTESFAFVKQREAIGGDMIFARTLGEYLVFGLMDCTGHGIPAALISMMGYTFLHRILHPKNAFSPGTIINELDTQFREFFRAKGSEKLTMDGMDGILCAYHRPGRLLKYTMAGRPLWYKSNGEWERIRPDRNSIGGSVIRSFKCKTLELKENDELFLFSDGLPDQFGGPKDKKFLTKRIQNILEDNPVETLTQKIEKLKSELDQWQGKESQTDDISFLALKV